jgi:hypothetical protein
MGSKGEIMNLTEATFPKIPMKAVFTAPVGSLGPLWVFEPASVTVDPRQTTIVVITLVTVSSSGLTATYSPGNALTWVAPGPPAWALGWWVNDPQDQSTVLNVKSINMGPTTKGDWGFNLNVVYDGQTYTSPDPTIINIEPTGGMDGAGEGYVLVEKVIDAIHQLVA